MHITFALLTDWQLRSWKCIWCRCSNWRGAPKGTWSWKILPIPERIPSRTRPCVSNSDPLPAYEPTPVTHTWSCFSSPAWWETGLVKVLQTGRHKVICVSAGGRSRRVGQLSVCFSGGLITNLKTPSSWASPVGTDGSQGDRLTTRHVPQVLLANFTWRGVLITQRSLYLTTDWVKIHY